MLLNIISLFSFRFSFIVCFLCCLFSRFFFLSLLWRFLVSFLVHILSCLLMAGWWWWWWWLRPGGWWLVAGGRWWLVMNWSSKVEFCAIRVSKKGKHGVHFVVPFLGPLFGHHVVNKQFVWSPKRYHYVAPFWGPFLKLFCFFFSTVFEKWWS